MATLVAPPAHYARGRTRPVQFIVIHATEGAEGPTSAEDGAAYDRRRTDSVSTHLFVDSDSAVREVADGDRAFHARYHGNEIGIGVELCGRAGQTEAQWRDAASAAMLRVAAREVAELCRAHDIPPRRLSVAEVRAAYYAPPGARPRGICGHVDVTKAFPEDGGTHWDPGPAFPWSEFLAMVANQLEADVNLTDTVPVPPWLIKAHPDDAGLKDGKVAVSTALGSGYAHARTSNETTASLVGAVADLRSAITGALVELRSAVTELQAAVAARPVAPADVDAIKAAVAEALAGLPAAVVAEQSRRLAE